MSEINNIKKAQQNLSDIKNIKIFDTTLRDGEQSPGCSMNIKEKLQIAKQLELLNVNIIEAGFAASSKGDFEGIQAVSENIKNCTIASLTRSLKSDIDASWEALKGAVDPRVHIFIATSPIHMEYKLKKTPDQVVEMATEAIKYASKFFSNIEFSAEDATRSDKDFLCRIFKAVIKEGVKIINIPDTVGYTSPEEYFDLISYIKTNAEITDDISMSVHCHNDLGLGVANSLAAIRAGATQIECTINGIGERAGNAALEEIIMNLNTRKDYYKAQTSVNTIQLFRTSKLLSQITGIKVQPNKAIVGENAFAHESGVHQHGVLANRETYEIMTPESIGLTENKMVLGKHSGRHAFTDRINTMGYTVDADKITEIFEKFKQLADKKKIVSDLDIEAIILDTTLKEDDLFALKHYVINSGNLMTTTANVCVIIKKGDDEEVIEKVAAGDGSVAASFNAINKIINRNITLDEYILSPVTAGDDAQGEVIVKITCDGKMYTGRGLSTDIIEAGILAYINAINKLYK